jgi:erythromycin esterase
LKRIILIIGLIFILIFSSISISTSGEDGNKSDFSECQDYVTLTGYVKDIFLNPIKGARVRVSFHDMYVENYSGADGFYQVDYIWDCRCLKNITVSKERYETESIMIHIGNNTQYNCTLQPLNIINVDDDGTADYVCIQAAIDAANSGDTIRVYSGRYIENIVIEKSLSIIGVDEEFDDIKNSGKPVIDSNFSDIVVSISSNDVLINGFDIVNSNTSYEAYGNNTGIYVSKVNNIKIEKCGIYNNFYGIILGGVKDSVIIDSIISNNFGHGLLVTEFSNDNIISDCNFTNNGIESGWGICLAISTGNEFKKCNIINNNAGFGIVKYNRYFLRNGIFQKNEIKHCNFINNGYYNVYDTCFGNNWNNNYYDDWIGISGNTFTKRLPYHITRLNFDMNPANEPFDIYLWGNFSAIINSLHNIIHPLNTLPLDLSDEELNVLSYMTNSEIVGLGEATHGTKEFFQLKHRIFSYLVENHGFKVFAFECDMGESYYLNNFITEGEGDIEMIMRDKMHFWTWNTEEVKELLVWMRDYNEHKSAEDKIYFIGVDCQFLTYQAEIILNYFDATNVSLSENYIDFLIEIDQIGSNISQYYKNMSFYKKIEIDQHVEELLLRFEEEKNELITASSELEYQLMKQLALNIKQVNDFRYGYEQNDKINYRDLYMAVNTIWTSDLFGENTKVALWAHNAHVANFETYGSIGYHLKHELNDDYQIIGFAFSKGSFTAIDMLKSRLTTHEIKQPPNFGSINYVFHHAQYDNFILREVDIQTNSDFYEYISQPQLFLDIGAGFNILFYNLGVYYYTIDLMEMFDVVIHWDTTEAAIQLS